MNDLACTAFVSTRRQAPTVGLDAALVDGLAPDGGLYIPQLMPHFSSAQIDALPDALPPLAAALLAPFFADSRLRESLPAICDVAFAPGAPLVRLRDEGDFLLELFHGPSAAFKDFGAAFLAECLTRLRHPDDPELTILVATSGDTGAAVAAAFHQRPGFRVAILYPEGRVSPRQAHGLECWGGNVQALRVDGAFDDCQRMVKAALSDTTLRQQIALGSANSISLGRLLPQLAYHAHAALSFWRLHGEPLNLVIPTGNLGNAAAAWMARAMGLPIGHIVLACNANHALPDFFAGGEWQPQHTIATLANAMDVGNPSNFERMQAWLPKPSELRRAFTAASIDDARIRATIRQARQRHGIVPCPHTACGLAVLEDLRASGDARPWAVAATAHPAKFDTIVEPEIGAAVPLPPALAQQLARPAQGVRMAASPEALARWLRDSRHGAVSPTIEMMDTLQRGPGRPKDLKKRAAILAAAKARFLASGFSDVSMQEVADLAGVSKLTLYSHFGDKAGLFVAAAEAHYETNVPVDIVLDWQGHDLRSELLAFGKTYRRSLLHPDSMQGRRLLQQSNVPPTLPASVWQVGQLRVQEHVQAMLAKQVEAGHLQCVDTRCAAIELLALLRGDLLAALSYGIALEEDDAGHAYLTNAVDTFLRAYAPHAGSLVTSST